MISGIFSAVFMSSRGKGGTGVAVFSNNTVHGGDVSFYYRGKFKLEESNQISATIEVKRHTDIQQSIFGSLNHFKLKLHGIVQGDNIALSGQIAGHPTEQIQIALKRIDDLVDGLDVVHN